MQVYILVGDDRDYDGGSAVNLAVFGAEEKAKAILAQLDAVELPKNGYADRPDLKQRFEDILPGAGDFTNWHCLAFWIEPHEVI